VGHDLIRLVFDAGPAAGLGHRRRMEALAGALTAAGATPVLSVLAHDGVSAPVEADVVVVDSYLVRADDARIRARRTVAVDDLGRDLAVDLLVEPVPAPVRADVDGGDAREQPRAHRVLRGLEYALIDPECSSRPPAPLREEVDTVLVTTGAADAAGVGASVAAELREMLPTVAVRLVVGPWSSSLVPEGVEPVRDLACLIDELAAAGLVVCSAGVTLLEALALGRPVVSFAVADNQRPYLDGLRRRGAIAASAPDDAARVAVDLAADTPRRRRLAAAGREAVDGLGATRVAQAVVALV
jgi:spore coat polysaccharide biosynthesis predicted glycosyltransferase SpsG